MEYQTEPTTIAPTAVLTSCERAFGGYLVKWEASTRLWWEMALARVKQLPTRYRSYDQAQRLWWIDDRAMPHLHDAFGNFDDAMRGTMPGLRDQPLRPSLEISRAFREMSLLPSAPPVVVKAAYRAWKKSGDASLSVRTGQLQRLDRAYLLAMTWAEQRQAHEGAAA